MESIADELVDDFWKNETAEKQRMAQSVIRDVKQYFPEFSESKTPTVITDRPTLHGLMATTVCIIDAKKNTDMKKLAMANENIHETPKTGTVEYRREDMQSLYISYTNNGRINIFGPKDFDDIRKILAMFIEDLSKSASSVLGAKFIELHPLRIDNTLMSCKHPHLTFDCDILCKKLASFKIRHSVWNGTVTIAPFPREYPKLTIRVFTRGTVNCMGKAPFAIKTMAYHVVDQIIENCGAYKSTATPTTQECKENKKKITNKAKQERHMEDLILKKRKRHDEQIEGE